jgi:hypothetical protein
MSASSSGPAWPERASFGSAENELVAPLHRLRREELGRRGLARWVLLLPGQAATVPVTDAVQGRRNRVLGLSGIGSVHPWATPHAEVGL